MVQHNSPPEHRDRFLRTYRGSRFLHVLLYKLYAHPARPAQVWGKIQTRRWSPSGWGTFCKVRQWKGWLLSRWWPVLFLPIANYASIYWSNLFCQLATGFKIFHELKADRPYPRDYSTHRQTPRSDNDSSLIFTALRKAKPLISTAVCQKFDFDLDPWPWPQPLTFDPDLWPWPWSKVIVMSKHDFLHLTLTFDLRPWPTIPT